MSNDISKASAGTDRVVKVRGELHRVTPIIDHDGQVIDHAIEPLMVEVHARDMVQIIAGAAVLTVPVALTEEAWTLGEQLSVARVATLAVAGLVLVAMFVYCNYYQGHLREHWVSYYARVALTYSLSLVVAAVLLTLFDRCPWGVDNVLAIKRVIVVGFPASMAASLSDSLR